MADDNRKWSWWAAEADGPEDRPEYFTVNETTRDAVIAAARREFGPSAHIIIVEATQDGPFHSRPFDDDGDCPLVERIIDKFMDDNGERWGEDGGETGFLYADLAGVLNDAFERFIADNHALVLEGAWAFTDRRNEEWLPPIGCDDV